MNTLSPPVSSEALHESRLNSLARIHQGKVRDIYEVDDRHLLIVATDRLSAFDVVLPDPIPGKGRILTAMSRFWFARTRRIVPNHVSGLELEAVLPDPLERAPVEGRAMVVRRLQPLPIEAVVRGYLIGSGWKDYQASGQVCGNRLPGGLKLAQRLPEPIYTPSSKAPAGDHDVNISYEDTVALTGEPVAARVRETALALYRFASAHAADRGIIIADTKFEFGVDENGELMLIDEALTPDSSRFWPQDGYREGISPPSFDKQFVRDYLETLDWNKRPPGPRLPAHIIRQTSEKYAEALRLLTN